jgi:hypothetical protein
MRRHTHKVYRPLFRIRVHPSTQLVPNPSGNPRKKGHLQQRQVAPSDQAADSYRADADGIEPFPATASEPGTLLIVL